MLAGILPPSGLVLEIAAGSGQHAEFFAGAFPNLTWQPTDPSPAAIASIESRRSESGLANVRPALSLDAQSQGWPVDSADAIVCINMIHIAPWSACEGLFAGAARLLSAGAPLFLYGPFSVDRQHTADSNREFDLDLRSRDPAWGVRDLSDVVALATRRGFRLAESLSMPANNLSLVFRKEK